MFMNKILVVIPTYNEKDNILKLISAIVDLDLSVLVVDDNSPDQTSNVVNNFFKNHKNVNVLKRKQKLGLGSAYRDGFNWGIKNNFNYLVEMDADFSHQVNDLKKMIGNKSENRLVIGSRYIPGGEIVGWSKRRELLSKLANKFVKFLSSSKVNDSTSGFRIYSKQVLEKIDYSKTTSNGYSFQIEMTLIAIDKEVDVIEVPITFLEREIGKSKMNYKIILEALKYLILLKYKKWFILK